MKNFVVGLTGGIGSGKSVTSDEFAALGIEIVDADQIARQVVEPQTPSLKKIAQHFGESVLNPDQTLNRKALREIIFHQPQQKKWLENLLHPIIRTEILHALSTAQSDYTLLVSPLLLETDQHKLAKRILVIDANEELQITRASQRDQCSPEHIKNIMGTQLSRNQRLARADDVLHNHGNLLDLQQQIANLHQTYLSLAADFQTQPTH